MRSPPQPRDKEVARVRAYLLRAGSPRVRMLVIVMLTGACGLGASYLLLRAGLLSMPVRYPIALLIAYLAFLGLLRLFVDDSGPGNPDLPGNSFAGSHEPSSAQASSMHDVIDARGSRSGSGSWFDNLGAADELVLPLLLLLAIVTIAFASAWVIASAPTLFAELVVDCALSAGLYRRLRTLERRHWLDTALRHTIWPFAATALVVIAFGAAAHYYRPQAHSIGEVFARPPGNG
ncbi:hypothetical protein [Dokdonella sp.]|uniref:hypothetical protein n=1 Tax=Dokdonella sp. TaxID=2291710 RepID=UPI003784B084